MRPGTRVDLAGRWDVVKCINNEPHKKEPDTDSLVASIKQGYLRYNPVDEEFYTYDTHYVLQPLAVAAIPAAAPDDPPKFQASS